MLKCMHINLIAQTEHKKVNRLTLAVSEGESDDILLAPTSCLIGAISVLVHEM